MVKKNRKVTFSCNQECKSNCCDHMTLRMLVPSGGKFDEDWFKLHGVEHVTRDVGEETLRDLSATLKMELDKAKEIPNMFRRQIEPAILKMMQLCLKEHWLKVPVKCKKLGKDGKCADYENRPKCCRQGNGGNDDDPFRIPGCPY